MHRRGIATWALVVTGAVTAAGCEVIAGLDEYDVVGGGVDGAVDGGGVDGTVDGRPQDASFVDVGAADVDAGSTSLGWTKKRKLSIDNANSATAQMNAPVLITLDPTRIDYGNVKGAGADLRFTDAAGKVLPYEIERWNAGATSLVWVAVPVVAANATTDIWIFYGNPQAPDGQQATAVWDSQYVGIWHLADAQDATGKHASSNSGATATSRGASPALQFAGDAYVETGASEQLSRWTVEAWFRAQSPSQTGPAARYLLSGGDNFMLQWDCSTNAFCRSASLLAQSGYESTSFGSTSAGTWHHVVATYNGSRLATYTDGVPSGGKDVSNAVGTNVTAWIGRRRPAPSWTVGTFNGSIDEVRISSEARSPAYAAFQYSSMMDTLVTYGPELANTSGTLVP